MDEISGEYWRDQIEFATLSDSAGELEEAERVLRRVIDQASEWEAWRAERNLGVVLHRMGRLAGASWLSR